MPPCAMCASPNAVVRPERITSVVMTDRPALPGRRYSPDTVTGSGNGIMVARAFTHVARRKPPFTLARPLHRSVMSAVNEPSAAGASAVSASKS